MSDSREGKPGPSLWACADRPGRLACFVRFDLMIMRTHVRMPILHIHACLHIHAVRSPLRASSRFRIGLPAALPESSALLCGPLVVALACAGSLAQHPEVGQRVPATRVDVVTLQPVVPVATAFTDAVGPASYLFPGPPVLRPVGLGVLPPVLWRLVAPGHCRYSVRLGMTCLSSPSAGGGGHR